LGERYSGEGAQPEPETEQRLQGEADLSAADFRRLWWYVPGARRARTVLSPLVALSVLFVVVFALVPQFPAALVLALVSATPYFVLWALGVSFAGRRAAALGPGPVMYAISENGLELCSSRMRELHAWPSFGSFVETPDTWVLHPRRGKVVFLPKRAFAGNTEHVSWQLRRRLEQRPPTNWGLRVGLGVGGLVLFLTLWHFFSLDSEGNAGNERGAGAPTRVAP
jgi:YcxB-like protein